MRSLQLVGLLLWRAGLLLAGGWAFYESFGWILRTLDVPRLMEVGLALALTGAVSVVFSLILERWQDISKEGDLSQ